MKSFLETLCRRKVRDHSESSREDVALKLAHLLPLVRQSVCEATSHTSSPRSLQSTTQNSRRRHTEYIDSEYQSNSSNMQDRKSFAVIFSISFLLLTCADGSQLLQSRHPKHGKTHFFLCLLTSVFQLFYEDNLSHLSPTLSMFYYVSLHCLLVKQRCYCYCLMI